ncbi:T9SS C-terminal target domain-containing protein [Pontibacter diazotrophicus]|uniref:T9SS C-terminal target domain-containing protein n=1 Tax=Pontibacter diazotrophicus TaxID=1400979 RepID=A0A3D8L093_9BACT|nr:T9SS type A sorting domain-containing protein [Pontibacter diazotrophicus]RDV10765.1 T9SS C-terminal target domain-containing protein [Pontibacter diazotrophicus]
MKAKPIISALALLLLPLLANATHIAGGYISYSVDPQNPRMYHFTQTVYTDVASSAADPIVNVSMGDGNTVEVPRTEIKAYSKQNNVNRYSWSYTYTSAGDYIVAWIGANRNMGQINVPAPSDQKSYYIYTSVKVNPLLVNNNGVKLASTPLFVAYTGEETKHNFISYDADGDKLTYTLVTPKEGTAEGGGMNIPGYAFPEGLTIDKFGELRWRAPALKGEYAIAVKVTEHRNGQPIGYTVVDFYVHVVDRAQQPTLLLLNQDRLVVNYDGSILARPDQPLKLEYFLRNAPGAAFPLYARQFSDLDTLDLASPSIIVRDSAGGKAVTLTLTPTADLVRQEPYITGMRGQADIDPEQGTYYPSYYFDWIYAYLIVGEQQPTSTEGDLAKAGFLLYPNPISNRFVIEAPDMPAMRVQLIDATGKAVGVLSLKPGLNHLTKPAALSGGLYFYTITSRHKPIGTGRLVVQ